MIKVGVISDTHGHLDRQVVEFFQGVDHIFHAGDIGYPSLILELEEIAPVTAVVGNMDEYGDFRETELVELEGRKFLVRHQVDPLAPVEPLKRLLIKENPDVVIFGHTHKQFCEIRNRVLFFNPGYAGKVRLGQSRSVAVLHCDATGITAEYRTL